MQDRDKLRAYLRDNRDMMLASLGKVVHDPRWAPLRTWLGPWACDPKMMREGQKQALIHCAAYIGDAELTRVLLEEGCPPDIPDEDSRSGALHWACFWGNVDVFNILYKAKADLCLLNRVEDSPLHWAVAMETSTGEWLFSAKAVKLQIADFLCGKIGGQINAQNERGFTALHRAAGDADLDFVELLYRKGARHMQDKQDLYPADIAHLWMRKLKRTQPDDAAQIAKYQDVCSFFESVKAPKYYTQPLLEPQPERWTGPKIELCWNGS